MTPTISPPLSVPAYRPLRKLWTVQEFHCAFADPFFEGRKFILIAGEIYEMPIPNPPHAMGIVLADTALRTIFGPGHVIRNQLPLVLNQTTDPIPDLAVVTGAPRDFVDHPTTALLVIEVSDSTLAFDTRDKMSLYAAGQIPEYWVVDLVHRQVVIHRDPTRDATQAFGFGYSSIQIVDALGSVTPLAQPGSRILVADLLP